MQQFDNTNRGAIWKNEKKTTDKHPDFTGSINVEGREFWLSGWKRRPDQSPNAPALSLSVQPKEPSTHQQAKADGYQPESKPELNDDIPF